LTIIIFTGLYAPTAGTAIMNGHDIRTNILAIRSSLGICPQHDVLFGELTVEEHLKFFSLLKGLNPLLLEGEINRMLIALGLDGKRHAQAQTLSGGMKRKLSVGIALCAGSKVSYFAYMRYGCKFLISDIMIVGNISSFMGIKYST